MPCSAPSMQVHARVHSLFSLFHRQIVHNPYTQKSNMVVLRASWCNCVTGSHAILLVLLKGKKRMCWITEIWEWHSYLINKSMNIGFQSNSGVKARKQAIVRREIIIALLKAPFNVTTPCIREVILITDFWDLKH